VADAVLRRVGFGALKVKPLFGGPRKFGWAHAEVDLRHRDAKEPAADEVRFRKMDPRDGRQIDVEKIQDHRKLYLGGMAFGAAWHHVPEALSSRSGARRGAGAAMAEDGISMDQSPGAARNGRSYFGDTARMRSDHHAGRTWRRRGGNTGRSSHPSTLRHEPDIGGYCAWGHMRFMTKEKSGINSEVFKQTIFLIVDRGPAHRAKKTKALIETLGKNHGGFFCLPFHRIVIPMSRCKSSEVRCTRTQCNSELRGIQGEGEIVLAFLAAQRQKKSAPTSKRTHSNIQPECLPAYVPINISTSLHLS
jgi:hypothetical protein